MKTILVPVDFSDLSWSAAVFATQVSQTMNYRLVLLNVVPSGGDVIMDISGNVIDSGNFNSDVQKSLIRISEEKMNEWKKKLNAKNIDSKVLSGQAEEVIISELHDKNYALCIMATHGALGMKEFFIGSHTEHIAMKSMVPLLSIKELEKQIKSVAVVSSFDKPLLLPEVLVDFCKNFNVQIFFLRILTTLPEFDEELIWENMNKTSDLFGLTDVKFVLYPGENDVEESIEKWCNESKPGLLVVESKNKTRLNRWISGNISADLVNHYDHALLTFRN